MSCPDRPGFLSSPPIISFPFQVSVPMQGREAEKTELVDGAKKREDLCWLSIVASSGRCHIRQLLWLPTLLLYCTVGPRDYADTRQDIDKMVSLFFLFGRSLGMWIVHYCPRSSRAVLLALMMCWGGSSRSYLLRCRFFTGSISQQVLYVDFFLKFRTILVSRPSTSNRPGTVPSPYISFTGSSLEEEAHSSYLLCVAYGQPAGDSPPLHWLLRWLRGEEQHSTVHLAIWRGCPPLAATVL